MQPHVNLGINFRKRFTVGLSKKKLLTAIKKEEKEINNAYLKGTITRESAISKLFSLSNRWSKIKKL